MRNRYDINLYGYWEFSDTLGLGCGIQTYDFVYVFQVKDDMAHAINEKGKKIHFHKTNITKEYFIRPSYKYHKKCSLGTRSSRFYSFHDSSDRHKNDCTLCQMYKFKKTVGRFKKRQNQ